MDQRDAQNFQESQMTEHEDRSLGWRTQIASVLVWTMVLHPILPLAAMAAPQDANVVNGDVTIETTGDTTVITASDLSIIEYSSFDIGSNETVQFIQPHELARVLNRIESALPTQIDGTLLANGHVYIVNPAGVFFGAGSVVDVGQITAAAAHISNEDFLAGIDRFTDAEGAVENYGEITAKSAALIGRHVANFGSIKADGGMIILAAGEDVLIGQRGDRMYLRLEGVLAEGAENTTGVENHGTLDAGDGVISLAAGDLYGMAIHHTGSSTASEIQIAGGDEGLVEVSGTLDASNDDGVGGSIHVTGDKVALIGATLDASGSAGGGDVRVGGDVRGEGELRTANRTYVDRDTVIRADATDVGDGGSVVVWGNEAAVNYGAVSAIGGANGGDGGFVEISSLGLLVDDGSVDLTAANGQSGTLLYDPQDIQIIGGTNDGDDDAGDDDELDPTSILFGTDDLMATPFEVYESEIEGTDANIVLEARHSITTSGTFTGDNVVLQTGNDLTLRTQNDADDATTPVASAMTAGINLDSGLTFRTSGSGSIIIEAATDGTGAQADVSVGTLTTGGGTGSVNVSSGNGDVSFGAINTGGGNVVVTAATGTAGAGSGGSITAGTVSAGSGDATFTADDMSLTGTINADDVTLQEATAGTVIDLGEVLAAPGPGLTNLGLTNAELANVTANTLRIGSGDAGAIQIGAAIDTSGIAATSLISAGPVVTTSGTITADGLEVDSAGAVISGASVTTLAATMRGEGNSFSFTGETDGFTVGSVGDSNGISTADSTVGSGDITLSSVGTINLNQALITGDDLVADIPATNDTALSGSISVTSTGGSVIGNTSGTMTTGSAMIVGTDAGDTATSGSIGVTADSGDVQLAAGDALATGDASAGAGTGTTGNITVSANSLSDGAMGGADVAQGTASGATTVDGVLVATTDVGGIRVTSGEDLTLGAVTTTNAIAAIDGAGAITLTDAVSTGSGNVELEAGGALSATAAAPQIVSSGDVTLAGTTVGSDGTPITINGGGTADSTLLVSAGGEVDVAVTTAGFDAIGVTQSDASADVDISQTDADGNDVVDINGAAGISTINNVDTNTSGNGVDFAYSLTETDGDVVIASGTMNLGGDTIVQAAGDIQVGTAAGTAVTGNGNDLALVADSDDMNGGGIADGVAGGSGLIDMGGGNLLLQATDAIGATGSGNRILVANTGNLAAESDGGGIYIENNAGSVDVDTVTVTSAALPGVMPSGTGLNADTDGGGAAAADDVILINSASNQDVTLTQDVNGFDVAIQSQRDILRAGGTITMQGGDLQLLATRNVGADGAEIAATGVADLGVRAINGNAHVQADGSSVNLATVFLEGTVVQGATAEVELEVRNAATDGDITITENVSADNVTLDANRDILNGGGVINMQGVTPDLQLRAGRNIGVDGTEIIANQVQDVAALAATGNVHLVANGAGVNVTTVNQHGTTTTGVTAPSGDVELRNTTTNGDITLTQNVQGENVTIAADRDIIDGGGTVDMEGTGDLQLIAGRNVGQDGGAEIETQDVSDFAAVGSTGDVHVNANGTSVNVTTVNQHGSTTTGVSAPTTTGTAGDVELRNTATNGDITITQNVQGENVTIAADRDIIDGGGTVDMEGAGDLQLIAGRNVGQDGGAEIEAQDVSDFAAVGTAGDVHVNANGASVNVTTVTQHGSSTIGVSAPTTSGAAGDVELRNTATDGDITITQNVQGERVTIEAARDIIDGGGTIEMEGGALQLIAGRNVGQDGGSEIETLDVADFAADSATGDVHVNVNGASVNITAVNQHGSATTGVTAQLSSPTVGDVELRNTATDGDITISETVQGERVTIATTRDIVDGGADVNMEGGALQLIAGRNIGQDGAEIEAQDLNDFAAIATTGDVHANARGANLNITTVSQHGNTTIGVSAPAAGNVELNNTSGNTTITQDVMGDTVTITAIGNLVNGGGTVDAATLLNLTGSNSIGNVSDGVNGAIQVENSSGGEVRLGTISSGGDVAIAAPTDSLIVTSDPNPGGTLSLDTPLVIQIETDTVTAGNDLLLNTNVVQAGAAGNQFTLMDPTGGPDLGPGSPVATIYRLYDGTPEAPTQANLTLTAGNDVSTGENQRLVTPGDLTITAGGDTNLADVTALTLDVNATNATFFGRGGSNIYDQSGAVITDTRGDVVANVVDFSGVTGTVDGNGGFLGTPDAGTSANGFVEAVIFLNGVDLEVGDLVGDALPPTIVTGTVLDIAVGGVRPPENSFVPPIPEEVTITGGLLSELNRAAASRKPIWGSEVVTVLTCSLYEGEDPDLIPPECKEQAEKEKSDPRFQTEPMVQARALYQQLYQDVDPLLDALQDAADAYLESAPGSEISGEAFREYVARNQVEAQGYLKQLSTLFSLLDQAMSGGGGDAGGVEELRAQLLDDITPAGMSPEELNAAIEATPANPRSAGLVPLAAADGLAQALSR